MSTLEDIKARIAAVSAPLEVMVSADRKWADVIRDGDPSDRVARCADDDHAELFAHAPADLRKLLAALEAIEFLAAGLVRNQQFLIEQGDAAALSRASAYKACADDISLIITEALA